MDTKQLILTYRGIEYYPIPLLDPENTQMYLYRNPFRASAPIEFVDDDGKPLRGEPKLAAKTTDRELIAYAIAKIATMSRELDRRLGLQCPDCSTASYKTVMKHFDEFLPVVEPVCHKIIDDYLSHQTDNSPEFNQEDMHDHRTVALAVGTDRCFHDKFEENRYLFSINLKHRMVTFPIGKCRPNEGLVDGLIREIHEEIGVMLESNEIPNEPYCKFTKVYDFTGQPVKIETNVFFIEGDYGFYICNRSVNKEPEKCGGLFIATIEDAINIAKTSGLLIADCVMCFRQCKMAE